MKKVIFEDYGPASVLRVTEAQLPVPADGELLVKVMAAGINPVDFKLRNGSMKMIKNSIDRLN